MTDIEVIVVEPDRITSNGNGTGKTVLPIFHSRSFEPDCTLTRGGRS